MFWPGGQVKNSDKKSLRTFLVGLLIQITSREEAVSIPGNPCGTGWHAQWILYINPCRQIVQEWKFVLLRHVRTETTGCYGWEQRERGLGIRGRDLPHSNSEFTVICRYKDYCSIYSAYIYTEKTKTSPCEKRPAMRVSDIMRLALGARLPLSLCSQMEQKCNSFLLCMWKSEMLGVEGEAASSSISGSLGMAGEPLSRRRAPGPISLYLEGWNHCWNPEKSQSGAWHKFSSLIFKAE